MLGSGNWSFIPPLSEDPRIKCPRSGGKPHGPVPATYMVPFHRAEQCLAGSVLGLLGDCTDRMAPFTGVNWDKAQSWLEAGFGIDLAPEREHAVRLTSTVAVLTGGPGCGKVSRCVPLSNSPLRNARRFFWSRRPDGPRSAWPSIIRVRVCPATETPESAETAYIPVEVAGPVVGLAIVRDELRRPDDAVPGSASIRSARSQACRRAGMWPHGKCRSLGRRCP
jgi:hypothetical protein